MLHRFYEDIEWLCLQGCKYLICFNDGHVAFINLSYVMIDGNGTEVGQNGTLLTSGTCTFDICLIIVTNFQIHYHMSFTEIMYLGKLNTDFAL